MNVADLKRAWLLVVDKQLNFVCGTEVKLKETFSNWPRVWSRKASILLEAIFSVLSKRLKLVYEERISRRGFIIGQYYKTLMEDESCEPLWLSASKMSQSSPARRIRPIASMVIGNVEPSKSGKV